MKLATRSGDARFPGGLDASNALSRNLSMLMDGFFNFLVGILMTAFTPEWHRLGDLAARTIVIDARRDTGSSRAPGDTL